MTRSRIFGVVLLAILIVSSTVSFAGKHSTDKADKLLKTSINDDKVTFLINNIFTYFSNNGDGNYNTYTGSAGFEWPKGSGNTAIFEDGVVWSGYYGTKGVAANLRTGGSAYRHGLQAGKILNSGLPYTSLTADNPGAATNRTFRIRPDINPRKTFADVQKILDEEEVPLMSRDVSITAQTIYTRYISDWNQWPAAQGAPWYIDTVMVSRSDAAYDPTNPHHIPGVPGADQTLWHVSNDLDAGRTTYLYGSNPIGIEFQRTIWGYRRTGALGNTIFVRNKVINKSDTPLDSTFFSQWSDPDLGDGGDDYAGCDISRSLGFVYNGKARDSYYGDKPPAVGYDFFQGPILASAGDSAIFNNKRLKGYKNLGMSAFNFFINSSATYTDPTQGSYTGTGHWYNLMNGKIAPTGADNIDKTTGLATKYALAGDPVTGKGWYEGSTNGSIAPPGDRRICLITGPFKLMPGDTQEVVVAELVGQGGDRLSSISVLKFYDDIAQSAYDNFFNLASPPPSPVVSISQLDGEILLDWSNVAQSTALEAYNSLGYTFQGYNVYQASTPAGDNQKLLATYDVVDGIGKIFDNEYDASTGVVLFKPVQFGNDNGVVRYYDATDDKLASRALINGQSYYYAVTAYGYNGAATPKSLESATQWKLAVPQKPVPGVRYSSAYGDTIASVHSAGVSDGDVIVTVVDPTKVTGHNYTVTFETVGGIDYWNLKDATLDVVVLSRQTNQAGDINYQVVDGLMVKVTGPAHPGMKQWSIPNGSRQFSPVGGYTVLKLEGFSTGADQFAYDRTAGTIGMAGNFTFGSIGTTLTASQYRNVLLKLAVVDTGAMWNPLVAPADVNYSKAYRFLRAAGPAADPKFAPWIINVATGYPYQDFNYGVPLSAWDMETTPPTRLAVGMFENNAAGASVDGRYWPPTTDGDNSINREMCFIFNKPYSTTADPTLQVNMSGNASTPLMWVMACARRNAGSWAAGNEFLITASHLNIPADIFTFTAPKVTTSSDVAKADVEKINVFPNPYFGLNLAETSKYQRYITFSHLPKNATIRIFTLAGVLVRTIVKPADETQQFLRWNLNNEAGLPVSAGMFIAYIDMPDLGKTKILKFAVIPESQILDKL